MFDITLIVMYPIIVKGVTIMEKWLSQNWMLIVIVIVIAIAIIIAIINKKRDNNRHDSIQKFEKQLESDGFVIDNKIVDINKVYSIYIDDGKQTFIIYNANNQDSIELNYSDLLSFDIKEDNVSKVSGRAGSAIVGGLIFGGLGAIAGASASRNVQDVSCNNITLILTTNNIHNPNIEIKIIDKKTNKNSEDYEIAFNQTQQIISILKIIIESNKNQGNKSKNKISPTQELREFKQLLDDGIITEEEFNKKKREILNKTKSSQK